MAKQTVLDDNDIMDANASSTDNSSRTTGRNSGESPRILTPSGRETTATPPISSRPLPANDIQQNRARVTSARPPLPPSAPRAALARFHSDSKKRTDARKFKLTLNSITTVMYGTPPETPSSQCSGSAGSTGGAPSTWSPEVSVTASGTNTSRPVPQQVIQALRDELTKPGLIYDPKVKKSILRLLDMYEKSSSVSYLLSMLKEIPDTAVIEYLWYSVGKQNSAMEKNGGNEMVPNEGAPEMDEEADVDGFLERILQAVPNLDLTYFYFYMNRISNGPHVEQAMSNIVTMFGQDDQLLAELRLLLDDLRKLVLDWVLWKRSQVPSVKVEKVEN